MHAHLYEALHGFQHELCKLVNVISSNQAWSLPPSPCKTTHQELMYCSYVRTYVHTHVRPTNVYIPVCVFTCSFNTANAVHLHVLSFLSPAVEDGPTCVSHVNGLHLCHSVHLLSGHSTQLRDIHYCGTGAGSCSITLPLCGAGGRGRCVCGHACVHVCVHKDLYPNSLISAMKGSLCSVTCAVRDTLLISHWKYYTKPVWYTKRVSQGAGEPCINLRCPI